MKHGIVCFCLLFITSIPALAVTHTVTTAGFTFSPAGITITAGDTIQFVLSSMHNAQEVSQATWNANGTTSNGGFNVPFGGGTLILTKSGTYYYVCTSHAALGMKGTITVTPAASPVTHTVTTAGFTFSPASISITAGDTIQFVLSSMHNALEVSQATWNANGTTSNGGFDVPFGGGKLVLTKTGTYYYVCTNHAALGMKGTITVTSPTGVAPLFQTSRTSISFGQVLARTTKTDSITVTNPGTAMLHYSASLSPGNVPFQFSSIVDSLPPSASRKLHVTFSPFDTGMKVAKIIFTHDATGSPDTITVTGTGIAPLFQTSRTSISFGQVLARTTKTDSITVTNPGTAMLHYSASLSPGNVPFQFSSIVDSLPPSVGRKFQVTFSPIDTGMKVTMIIFTHDAAGSPDTITVSGTGIAPLFQTSRTSISFGQVLARTTKTDSVTVTNPGTAMLHYSASLSPNNVPFQFSSIVDSLPPSAGRKFQVTFSPIDTGMKVTKIIFTHDAAGSPDTITVSGTGIAPLFQTSRTSISFGQILARTTKTDSVTVTNPGTAMLHYSASLSPTNAPFQFSSIVDSLPPSVGRELQVTFSPIDTGMKVAKIIFTHDATGSPDTVTLSGEGGAQALFSATPQILSYGNVESGTSKQLSLIVRNEGAIPLRIDSVKSDDVEFAIAPAGSSITPSDSQQFYITFHPITTGVISGNLIFFGNAATSPDTVRVTGNSILRIRLNDRWNMISVPLIVADSSKKAIYPTATSNAFAYEGGYSERDYLKLGIGYWLKFNGAQNVDLLGISPLSDTVFVLAGWNMVGSAAKNVSTSDVAVIGTSIQSVFYGYDSGYEVSDTIRPGKAYWVKVSGPGKLLYSIDSIVSTSATTFPRLDGLNRFSSLVIEDAMGNVRTLYFGAEPEGNPKVSNNLTKYESPPVPPRGAFDARFASQRILETVDAENPSEFPILLSSASYPLTLSWHMNPQSCLATVKVGEKQYPVNSTGTIRVMNSSDPIRLSLAGLRSIPRMFALEQNYPNPFNPSTVIRYQLPVESKVVLKVYNVLGQVVATLVDEVQEPGFKSVTWDGASAAGGVASGVYLYRIQAGDWIESREMLLLK